MSVERIQQLLAEIKQEQIDPTTELIESGRIDSFDIMRLIARVEKEFAVAFEGNDIDRHTFGTITSIAALIERKINATR